MSTVKGHHITTRIPSSKYTLKWSIDKFDKLIIEKTVKSPLFHPISGTEWYSELEKSSEGVEWTIYNNSRTSIHVHHGISIVDFRGKILFKKSLQKQYTNANNGCIVIDGSDRTSLNNSEHVITFVCHMTLTGNEIKSEITELHPGIQVPTELHPGIQDPVHNLKKLSDDLKTMYGVSLYTDVCLRVDGNILRAHRALLSARSPVFAKMFEHELNEKKTNEIQVTDLETSVLKHLISFLYTGIVVDESYDSVLPLYYAADKYDVTDLRQRCGDVLLAKISIENACQVLALAERHTDDSLKKSAMTFVETYLEPILATDGWRELLKSKTNLAAEVMSGYTEKRKLQKEAQKDNSQVLSLKSWIGPICYCEHSLKKTRNGKRFFPFPSFHCLNNCL